MSGELSHHVILDAVSHDRSVMVCNHSNTERGFLKELRARLESELGEEFTFVVSQTDRDPLSVFCLVCFIHGKKRMSRLIRRVLG